MNNWIEINERLHVFKIMTVSLGGIAAILLLCSIYLACRSPLVVSACESRRAYEVAQRRDIPLDEKSIEEFLTDFIHFLCDWKANFNPLGVIKVIGPFATDGLVDRVKSDLIQRREKDFKDKTISQGITNLEFNFSQNQVVASFDKVLRVNGIPLIIPTEISFNLVRGTTTPWNPMGLYVNGIVEHEGSKD